MVPLADDGFGLGIVRAGAKDWMLEADAEGRRDCGEGGGAAVKLGRGASKAACWFTYSIGFVILLP